MQEKQDLLKAFVNNSENLDNIEMQLVVARTSEGEVEHHPEYALLKKYNTAVGLSWPC